MRAAKHIWFQLRARQMTSIAFWWHGQGWAIIAGVDMPTASRFASARISAAAETGTLMDSNIAQAAAAPTTPSAASSTSACSRERREACTESGASSHCRLHRGLLQHRALPRAGHLAAHGHPNERANHVSQIRAPFLHRAASRRRDSGSPDGSQDVTAGAPFSPTTVEAPRVGAALCTCLPSSGRWSVSRRRSTLVPLRRPGC